MTDISKCPTGCDKQETCYRWTAPVGYWQSYADFKPDENGNCEGYWERNS